MVMRFHKNTIPFKKVGQECPKNQHLSCLLGRTFFIGIPCVLVLSVLILSFVLLSVILLCSIMFSCHAEVYLK